MKKVLKSAAAILLVLTLAFSAFAIGGVFAEETEPLSSFAVSAKGSGADSTALGTVSWWKSDVDGKYYMFMPSKSDLSSITVWFTATDDVMCGGVKLESGAQTRAFANGGEFVLTVGDAKYTVVFLNSSKLPTMFINTPEGGLDRIHADKSHKEKGCTMLALNSKGTVDYDAELASMKGRGNSTWGYPKKPYNIKLGSKAKLFGMEKAKNWCLIANYIDLSLMRNQIAYNLGADIGMNMSPDCRNIDLYVNGEYKGVYLITEKVEINKNRVDIFDLEEATEDLNPDLDFSTLAPQGIAGKYSGYIENSQRWYDIPNEPENITGGYLLELELTDRYAEEPSGFITKNTQPVVLKSPEYATEAQAKYISGYWQELEDALYSETGYNSLGKHYTEYIDIVSWAKQYLIQEWTSNWDAGLTSNFFYKDVDSKLFAGPLWDFDTAIGNSEGRDGINLKDPTNLHAKSRNLWYNSLIGNDNVKATPNIYALCYRHADFAQTVEEQMQTVFAPAVKAMLEGKYKTYVDEVKDSAIMNAIRWNCYETTDTAVIADNYNSEINYTYDFIKTRTDFLSGALTLKNEGLTIAHIPSQKRTGSEITPEITVKCLDRVLTEGVDYTVAFSDNVEKGTATVTVTGMGNYEGMEAQTTFKILLISDPLDWTGGSGEERAKESLNKFGAKFVDTIELILYYIVKPFKK